MALIFHKKKLAYLKYASMPSDNVSDTATHPRRKVRLRPGALMSRESNQSTSEVAASMSTNQPLLL